MFNQKLTPEQHLSKVVVDIMSKDRYVHLSGILLLGSRKICDVTPTACTNGRDEFYGRSFVQDMPTTKLRFLVLHENYHKLYKHLHTWKHLCEKDPQVANIAMDYNINGKICDENKDGWAVMPEGGLYDEKFRNADGSWQSTSEIFNTLYQDKQNQGQGQGQGQGDGGGFDTHDWDGAQSLDQEEVDKLHKEIDESLRQGVLLAGKQGLDVSRDIGELLEPQVNWRETLRDFIQTTCVGSDYSTYAKPNRRYLGYDMILPSGINEKIGELVVAIDTSGSINVQALTSFMTEVKEICDMVHPASVRILYWDTAVCQDEFYEGEDIKKIVSSTKPKGGGGTCVECVPDYLKKNNITPQATIVLTDGHLYRGWGKWDNPVLWCVLNNSSATPDVGQVVHIKSMEM